MELFLPVRFEHRFETAWIRWDHLALGEWHVRSIIESFGRLIPFWLELCYLLVYGTGFFCVALFYFQHRRGQVNRFLTIYLIGTLLAYALFPYFPSEPPRVVFPDLDRPLITTWARSELMDLEGRDDSCRRLPERTRFVGLLCGLGNVFGF